MANTLILRGFFCFLISSKVAFILGLIMGSGKNLCLGQEEHSYLIPIPGRKYPLFIWPNRGRSPDEDTSSTNLNFEQ